MARAVQQVAVGGLALALLAGGVLAVAAVGRMPVLDGRLALAGLQAPVQVRRDAADVTHVLAQNPHDAWRALGHVHAQERAWQLEFNRRLMHGTLSEILGPSTLDTDKLMRGLAIREAAQAQLEGLPPVAREALLAYADGINGFFAARDRRLPPEFDLLGVQPGRWEPADSVGWALIMALDLGGNWGHEFARLSLLRTLDTERLWQLMPPYPGEAPATDVDLAGLYRALQLYVPDPQKVTEAVPPTVAPAAEPLTALAAWSQDFVREAGWDNGRGSNNWVVHGSRTVSGKPLLANDPHLGLSAPAIWYFARLQAPAGRTADGQVIAAMDVLGATLPGLPFVVLGRTAQVAWGFTNTGPDVQDLYLEQLHPENPLLYRTPEGWAPFGVREEIFRVKGQDDVSVPMRTSRHGPVLSDVQSRHAQVIDTDRFVIALRWSALDEDNRTVLAGLRANQATSVAELLAAFADYHSPMQSVVAADVEGATAFKAVGRVPVRFARNRLRGVAPAPGWDPRYDWRGWIPAERTPAGDAATAAQGWIATANQRVVAPGYPYFLTQDWVLPYRYERIAHLLEATPRHDVASMAAIQGDTHSLATVPLLPHLLQAPARHALAPAARQALQGFDGEMAADRPAPLIFAAWADELARGLIVPRIGQSLFDHTYGKRDYRAAVEGILARDDAWWCQPLSCAQQSGQALDRALQRLQAAQGPDVARWRWGEAHRAVSSHRPLGHVAALARFFDVQVPTGGDGYTVNVGQYNAGDAKAPFANRHAASLRAIYDLADLEQSRFIYQTGQSGLFYSPRYRDMQSAWALNQHRLLQRQPAQWRHQLWLDPAPIKAVKAPASPKNTSQNPG